MRSEEGRLNIALLDDCIEFAKQSQKAAERAVGPDGFQILWDQSSWTSHTYMLGRRHNQCGTTFCLAGYAAYVEGFTEHRLLTDCTAYHDDGACSDPKCRGKAYKTVLVNLDKVFGKDYLGPIEDYTDSMWPEVGGLLLGLSESEAMHLFSGSNTFGEVKQAANQILRNHGYEPRY